MTNLYNQLNPQNQTSQNIPQSQNNIGTVIQALKNGGNPQQLLNTMLQNNPQLQSVMQMINNSNLTPKQLFYNMAQKQGINVQDILSQLK